MKRISIAAIVAVALIAAGTTAYAQPKEVTFDYGAEGWSGRHFTTVVDGGDEHGNKLNITSIDYANNNGILVGWYDLANDSDPAFIGDYTLKGDVRICVDVNVNVFDFLNWGSWIEVEEYREIAISLRDLDMNYQDPNYPDFPPFPYAEAQFFVSNLHSRDDGWATYCADVTDVDSFDLPDGWTGFGGGEDPNTYMPIFPPGYGWSDLLAGVDEIHVNALLHGWFYSYNNLYDIDFDNISIGAIPPACNDTDATVFVDDQGIVRGGDLDGSTYNGVLKGTTGDDVIVGTDGNDTINGFAGDDVICGLGGDDNIMGLHGDDTIDGGAGNDNLHGQSGSDHLSGGEGEDHINGGPGYDTCLHGENVNNCDVMMDSVQAISSPGIPHTVESEATGGPGALDLQMNGTDQEPAPSEATGAATSDRRWRTNRVRRSR